MEIKLTRLWKTPHSTQGILTIDQSFHNEMSLYTLEPVTRDDDQKPRAIPPGIYKVVSAMSPKRGYKVGLLQDVPGFTAIEIHIGNFPKDTEGCILVGLDRISKPVQSGSAYVDMIVQSSKAFKEFMALLEQAESRGEITTIEIVDPETTVGGVHVS